MDTSRSTDWTATALVFSGRPDPSWPVPPDAVVRLLALWDELPVGGSEVEPPPLGYRGTSVSDPDGTTWLARGGTVQRSGRQSSETRLDTDGRWERTLVRTAPDGLLPPLA